MIVEHVFVTTHPSAEAMQKASMFLASHGFVNAAGAAFPVGGGEWNALEMKRGVKNAARAKSVAQLPQVAHVNYDRGRVSLAISMADSGGGAFGGGSRLWMILAFGVVGAAMAGSQYSGKKYARQRHVLLTALASGVEQSITGAASTTANSAEQQIQTIEAEIAEDARRRSRRMWIAFAVIQFLMALVISLAIFADH